ncbi:MAG: LysM peptidoglycan-binding domain-containing protein [Gammaproteobacteria bacterium]|nr:MAG: LysM peptidoglycan-binding domain-containing protein [Gammaproteobacteria bacterium]
MKRKCILLVVLGILPGVVSALGLGNIELRSNLNEPFEARIELLSVTAEELSTLRVGLADIEAYQRARVERLDILGELRFTVEETESGPDFILVTTREPLREPFLDFLVEANWSRGRLLREYTVLLDPPLYDAGPGLSAATVSGAITETAPGTAGGSGAGGTGARTVRPGITGDEYGPTVSGDTLWSIASRARGDASISVQQMMLALLRTNPDAFINGNINGLKSGQILRIPDDNEITAIPDSEARAEISAQNSAWGSTREEIASIPSTRPETAPAVETEEESVAPAAEEESSEAELRLVAPKEDGAEATGGASSVDADESDVDRLLTLANEQIEAISTENEELRAKMSESESIIEDLQRLISLKDDELAAIQQQLAGALATEGQPSTDTATPAETAEEPVAAEPPETPEETVATEVVAEEAPVASPPATPAPTAQEPAPEGLVDTVKTVILENILVIVVGLAAVLAAIGALLFISRRKRVEALAPVAEPTEIPDHAGSEDETIIPGEEVAEEKSESEAITDIRKAMADAGKVAGDKTEFAPPPPATAPAVSASAETAAEKTEFAFEEEEDALGEVNVFLAYEHFDQAEEFVRDAIAGEPNNLDYHAKLLEVFYAAGNRKAYEVEAKVLQGLTKAQGPHWDMALAMWQELSPSRALFAAAPAEEEAVVTPGGGGIVDLTSGAEVKAETGTGLDFNLGMEETVQGRDESGSMLDITSGRDEGMLDVTAAVSSEEKEDLLDVTAAVRLEPEQSLEAFGGTGGAGNYIGVGAKDEEVLDITSEAGTEGNLLDVTAISSGGEDEAGAGAFEESGIDFNIGDLSPASDDLLDVTHSHPDFERKDLEEDLLDVTSATAAGLDAGTLFDVDEAAGDESRNVEISKDAGAPIDLELSLSGLQAAEPEKESNVIDFDIGGNVEHAVKDEAAELTMTDDVSGDEFALDLGEIGEADNAENSLGMGDLEISQGGVDLDLMGNDSSDDDLDFSTTMELPKGALDSTKKLSGGLDFDLKLEEEKKPIADSLQLVDLELGADEEDEDEDHTVFVPRAGNAEEQSDADEIATKLDLAKAYVELGDKDSAKTILNEIISDGNAEQQRQAKDLLRQCS